MTTPTKAIIIAAAVSFPVFSFRKRPPTISTIRGIVAIKIEDSDAVVYLTPRASKMAYIHGCVSPTQYVFNILSLIADLYNADSR